MSLLLGDEMSQHHLKKVSPIQLVLIINTSLSNRYLFIEFKVHAATHVHTHTHTIYTITGVTKETESC